MRIFPLPNCRDVYGISYETPTGTTGMGRSVQTPQDQRQFQAMERQLRGATAFSAGVAGRVRPVVSGVDVMRPGMHDSIANVDVIGGIACRHGDGRPLRLLLLSNPNTMYRDQQPMAFCVMKVPSQGTWTAQREFVMDRSEYELMSDLLPVLCDPYYQGDRAQGLSDVCRRHHVVPNSLGAIPSSDQVGLRRLGSDATGRPNWVPSDAARQGMPGRGIAPDDRWDDEQDDWDDGYGRDGRDRYEDYGRDDAELDDEHEDEGFGDAAADDGEPWIFDAYADPYAYDEDEDEEDDVPAQAYYQPTERPAPRTPLWAYILRVLLVVLGIAVMGALAYLAFRMLVLPSLG